MIVREKDVLHVPVAYKDVTSAPFLVTPVIVGIAQDVILDFVAVCTAAKLTERHHLKLRDDFSLPLKSKPPLDSARVSKHADSELRLTKRIGA